MRVASRVAGACRGALRSRATSKPSPICAAMLASSWRSSAVYASSDRRSPSTITATSARSCPTTGTSSTAPVHSSHSCSSGGRRRAGDRGSFSTMSSGSSDQRSIDDQAAVERQRFGAAVQHRDRGQPPFVDAAHQDRRHQRVQRFVDLIDDHRREIRRVGLEAHPAGQRQQDLARVVLLAEEPLVEPLARALAVAEGRRPTTGSARGRARSC